MGDLNARIGQTAIAGLKQRFNEDVINENGESLINFCAQNNLRINNTFFDHFVKYEYTFENSQGQNSVIDYIITSRHFMPQNILDVRTLNSANIGSDHFLLLCKLRMGYKYLKHDKSSKKEKYNVESLDHDSIKDLLSRRLTNKIEERSLDEEDSPNTAWEKIKTNILEAATEALGKRSITSNKTGKNKTPWYTEEIKRITNEKKNAYLKYRSLKTEESEQCYKDQRNATNKRIREIKESYWEGFTKSMERDMYGAQRKVWKMLRNRKLEVNETVKLHPINIDKWESYFKELYKNKNDTTTTSDSCYEYETESEVVTLNEIEYAIKTLKNRKAPGHDNITNEMLKYGGIQLQQELIKLFNIILNHEEAPSEWKTSITIPIFKKGKKDDPHNYRGITLLHSTQKLFTKLLSSKLQPYLHGQEEQQGFRKNRSTTDCIFILQQIMEKSIEFDCPAFMCFVDLKKAFDRVRLKDVLEILKERKVPRQIVEVIRNLNTNCTTKVMVNEKFTNSIECTTGIRQGDSLSPQLFNLIIDKIISEVNQLQGYKLNNQNITIICYADDAVLIADSEDNLQRLLHRFVTTGLKFNMEVSTAKTKSIVISKEPIRCKLEINQNIIEQVMQFKYLGIDVSHDRNIVTEVRERCTNGAKISGFLRDIIWKNKYMNVESKTRVYKTIVRPILTYGAEARAENTKTKQLLRSTEMHTLRTIAGKTRWDCCRNHDIRIQTNTDDIVKFIRSRRRAWNEHVSRASNNRLIKIARDGIPVGRRRPGRPPKRWAQSWISSSIEN